MDNADLIAITTSREGDATVIAPAGDIDLGRSPTLRTYLKEAQRAKPKRLIVDLAQVEYMDSSGVATLVEALQISRKHDTSMVLCNIQDKVRSIFEIARLDSVFQIVPDVKSALEL
jgi:anti-anti-sigma factor